MNTESIEDLLAASLYLSNEKNTIDLVKHLSQRYESQSEFRKFTCIAQLENHLEKYLDTLKEIIRMCAEYDEETSLYDIFLQFSSELEKSDRNLPCEHDFFNEFQQEITRLVKSIDNADVIVFVLKTMDDFSMFWEEETIKQTLSHVIGKIPEDRAELLLDCKKLRLHSCFDGFLCRVLITHEDKEIRDQSLQILKLKDNADDGTLYISLLEEVCQEQLSTVLSVCLEHVNNGELLTFSCFERMTESFSTYETQCIVAKVIELNLQRIPKYFVEKFKDYTTTNKPGILGIGESLIKGKYCEISDICCICELIRSDVTCKEAMNLISTALKFANDIPVSIFTEIEEKATSNINAGLLLSRCQKIFGRESIVDTLANSREKSERIKALAEIKINKRHHNSKVIKLLETLIQYDEDLRIECFETLTSILPENYSKQGFSPNLKTIISNMNNTITGTVDLPNVILSFLIKDRGVDLSEIFISFIYEDGNLSLNDAVPLIKELFNSTKGKRIIIMYFSHLLKKVRSMDNWQSRDNLCEKLRIVSNSMVDGVKPAVPNFTNIYNPFLTYEHINDDFLERLKNFAEEGYPIPGSVIISLINALRDINFESHYYHIGKILNFINETQNFGQAGQVFNAMLDNNQLFITSDVTDLLIGIVRKMIIPKEMWRQFTMVFNRNVNQDLMKQNFLKVANLFLSKFELPLGILEKVAEILSNNTEDVKNRILAAQILIQYVEHFGIPTSIIKNLEDVVKECNMNNSWKLYDFVFRFCFPTSFLRIYYYNLKDRLIQRDKLDSFDEFINADTVTDLKKFRLLKTLSCVVSKNLNINVGKIFVKFEEHKWQEMLLRNVIIVSTCEYHVKTYENKFVVQGLWQNINLLKIYLCGFYVNQTDLATNMFEDILQEMIYKQSIFSFNLNTINDILTMLRCSDRAFKAIFRQSNCFLSDIRQIWMEVNLINHQIESNHEKLVEICRYFKHGMTTLELVFSKLKNGSKICELLKFFKMMDHYLSTEEEKKHLLANDIVEKTNISNWILQLEKKFIKKMLDAELRGIIPTLNVGRSKTGSQGSGTGLQDILEELHGKLAKLRGLGWVMESIKLLIKLVKNKSILIVLLQALDIIIVFQLREYDTDNGGTILLNIFQNSDAKTWIKQIKEMMILRIFPGTYTKPMDALVKEILELNVHRNLPLLDHEKLVAECEKITNAGTNKSRLCDSSKSICDWSKEQILLWALKFKNFETPEHRESLSLYEKIAVVKKAVEVTGSSKIIPRTVQLLSLLFMLTAEKEKGRLMQINTGEGKTTIIAMFAAIKALEGHKVDIITSSPELAIPQSEDYRLFFRSLGLNVSHIEEGKNKLCYTADVVYGSANSFMGDVLRDEYHKLKVRCGRKFDIAVVDEVDSMCIDGKDHMVMLSSPMPALNHLEPVLAEIWVRIHSVANAIIEKDEKDERTKKMTRVVYYSEEGHEDIPLEGTKEQFLKKFIELHLRRTLRDLKGDETLLPEDCPKIEIPEHLRQLTIEVQLSNWIDSAIRACYRCDNEKDYIIENNRILPVDAMNTGIVQLNMLWSNGLHQFLQFKHGANVTPESLTTNFISNIAFFRRYGCRLYGLTGTLGSIVAREMLDETYNVDSLIIPSFQKKQYFEMDPIISQSKEEWYQNVVQSSIIHLKNGRAVLIITQYIEDAKNVSNMFRNIGFDMKKIKMYLTAGNSDAIKKVLKAGKLIIATNIAGRGTDIKPSEKVENNGGLHVCVTFLPVTERVKNQNVGRTSRTGHRGTGQFVLLEQTETNIIALMERRNEEERASLRKAKDDMAKVLIKDKIFQMFCELLHETVHVNNDANNGPANNDANSVLRRAVEERFAIWLKMNEANMACETDAIKKFEVFKEEIRRDAEKNSLPKNPCYHIISGNRLREEENYDGAIEEYSKAADMDPKFAVDAYYYRAFSYIAKYGKNVTKNRSQIEKAIADLKTAEKIIEDTLEPMNLVLLGASSGEVFSKQIERKLELLTIQKNCIRAAIGCDVENIIQCLEATKIGTPQEEIVAIDERINEITQNKEKYEKGTMGVMMNAGVNIVAKIQDNKNLLADKDITIYDAEIAENNYNGQVGYFQVTEDKPLFRSFVLFFIGVGKIFAGIAMLILFKELPIVTVLGFTLIGMGFFEIITAFKDGFFARNKIQNWENCGFCKFALLEGGLAFYALKAIGETIFSRMKGNKKLLQQGRTVSQKEILENSKNMGEKIGQELAPEINEILDKISDAKMDAFLFSDMQRQIFDGIKIPFQQILVKHEKLLRILQSDDNNRNNEYKEYIHSRIDELVFQNDLQNWFQKAYTKIKSLVSSSESTKTVYATKIVTKVCDTLPQKFETCLNDITRKIQTYESENESSKQISQNTVYKHHHDVTGDIDTNKGKVPQEQVKFEEVLKKLSDNISFKLSGKIADHIHQKLISPALKVTTTIDKMNEKFKERKREYKLQNEERREKIQVQIESRLVEDFSDLEMLKENAREEKIGMIHLDAISAVINRQIVIFNEREQVMRTIGSSNYGEHVNIQYRRRDGFEYWTLPGKTEPKYKLLNVIAKQIDENCDSLKDRIIKMMETKKNITDQILDSRYCYEQVLTG